MAYNKAILKLVAAAEAAADWLEDTEPGTHQHELGLELRAAISELAGVH